MAYERQTARKCRIGHLTEGNYVQKEGWDPNYVETELGDVSRVNLMGIVVNKDSNILTVDDGTARIEVRTFQGLDLSMFDIGERVLIIGRPRLLKGSMMTNGLSIESWKLI